MPSSAFEVLIVGRPNVGKSTLFNRLSGKGMALVDDRPGSTRDLKSCEVFWNGMDFTITDSGGWVPGEKGVIAYKVGQMIEKKVAQVQALLFVVDGKDGKNPEDVAIARNLRKYGLPIWLVVNKADRPEELQAMAADFREMGFEHVFPVSSLHGIGIDDFLDSLVDVMKGAKPQPQAEEQAADGQANRPLRIAILGKPNVGKSSLANAILGENRVIVDDTPGTTHDAIPILIETEENPLMLVDTAGIRAPKSQDSRIEKLSVEQTLRELQTCQVVLLLLDGEKGITHQDVTIGRIIAEAFRPVVIVINKWDIHPTGAEQARAERIAKRQLRHIHFAPVLFISAKTGMHLDRVLPMAYAVYEESCRENPTRKVNQALQDAVLKQQPPFRKGDQMKIFYGYQRTGHPPVFEVFTSHPESAAPSYMRYLEAELRHSLDLPWTPLQIVLKEKTDKKEYTKKNYRRNFDPNQKHYAKKRKERREKEKK